MENTEKHKRIFTDNVQAVYRFVYLRTRNKEIAEDITSEAFTKMLTKEDLDEGLVKFWLFRVAHNLLVDRYRGKAKEVEFADEDLANTVDDSGDYDKALLTEEFKSQLDTQLQKLPAKTQEVIGLKVWEELTFAEIADILSEKESTIKLRYYRGVEKLKQLVDKDSERTTVSFPLVLAGISALTLTSAYTPAKAFTNYFISTQISTMTIATTGIFAGTKGLAAAFIGVVAVTGTVVIAGMAISNNPAQVTPQTPPTSFASSSSTTTAQSSSAF